VVLVPLWPGLVGGGRQGRHPPLFTGAGVHELPRDGVTLVLWRDPKVVLGDRSARTPT
jgi:hypothetical protein